MGDSFLIAIDFGTAYSGYAFSVTPREEVPEPRVKFWGEEVGLETPKTPTCILFDDKKKFISFGYKARQDYITMKSEAKEKYFFDSFKMLLYNKKLNRDLMIKAANGKEMKALDVFAESLKFLKKDALKTISDTTGRDFKASDFTWVLTVPAIWDPSAKQFMREAAAQAGIVKKGNEEKLVIALEPEAASVYCKKLPAEGFITEGRKEGKLDETPGTQYIVVDCGGGTIDITVHEVQKGGALKELHKASGNSLGGQNVERKFKECLRDIFTDGVWADYEDNYPSEVQRMLYDFSLFKRNDVDIEIDCPLNLGKMAEKKKPIEKFFEGNSEVEWDDGAILIPKEKLRSFFQESLDGITNSVREILKKNHGIKYILLVGGFANSKILTTHITREFRDNCEVLCPFKAQEAVLRGAVEFGRNPGLVVSRKSAFTYGTKVIEEFKKLIHREDKKYTNAEGVWCDDIFMVLVEIDEDVGWNEVRKHMLTPVERDQTKIDLTFYRTKKQSVTYVDEVGVEEIGSFLVDSADTTRGLEREIELQVKFGFTEMKVTGIDKETGSTQTIKLDFMTKP